ncbi:serine hydrolase [Branchiibius sp. NY16-3462-2]|uniref:serine hydrolase domain-containing protein n=1 Tax=Branchiibius sp. NY16-3462-2 TaxID=1807500 RepID=UPI0007912A76|nr:serine hydrolase domain-containing protein [Branchiibius sp. NY16-3462-2]KYH45281.1 hypothetical protein AZH51_05230 [Branchiibius sp. NY16-3462-2]
MTEELSPAARAALTARIARAQHCDRAPSVVAGVRTTTGLGWTGAVGDLDAAGTPAGPDTAYRIGSITKTFTAVLVMQLVAEGRADLTDPITARLPELTDLPDVSVQALLTHGAGLYAETDGPWWERSAGLTWEQLIPSIRQAHIPASRFHYTNVGFAVLGQLVARLRGQDWRQVLQERILDPLGLEHTTYDRPATGAHGLAVHPYADLVHAEPAGDTGAMAPAGQLWSTVDDLLTFGQFLVRGDAQVLPEQFRERMLIPTLVDDEPGERWTRAYGLGVDVTNLGTARYVGHGGSMPGFQSALRADPESGDCAVLLMNSTAGVDLSATELITELRRYVPLIPPAWQPAGEHTADLDLTGTWFWGPRPHVATLHGADLILTPVGSGRGARFVRLAQDRWLGQDGYFAGEPLQVHARGEQSAYLDVGSFRFTRTPYDPASDIPGGVDDAGWH